ncbi:rho GTPase-activating protein gacZ-like [Oppia nitens]|uniref:rho GTPase-activating protein gacZ-like n=1 Tax=Oppia nitens TaxID=1686743 RepID=UPI0023DB60DC|nr:rho GTPase-activating protein gacZ-like [Oppia nitens]
MYVWRLVERFQTMRAHIHQSNIDSRPSILSQPLPPIPGGGGDTHKKAVLNSAAAAFAANPIGSNEMLAVYGHQMLDENIYSVPQDQANNCLSRPRSAGFENGGAARVQRSRSIPRSHPINSGLNTIHYSSTTSSSSASSTTSTNTNTNNNNNTGPPLPPRASTLERNHSHSSTGSNSDSRPVLPRRQRKCSTDLEYKLIDIDIESIPSTPTLLAAIKRATHSATVDYGNIGGGGGGTTADTSVVNNNNNNHQNNTSLLD